MEITDTEIRHFVVPLEPSIGDSQIDPIDQYEVAYLEVETDTGHTGIGVEGVNFGAEAPLPPGYLAAQFAPVADQLSGAAPGTVLHRQTRGRGGAYGDGQFDRLLDFALWDLVAKHHNLPLYELLGGTTGSADAYASGLAFHHDDATTRSIYRRFVDRGFFDAKVKIGYDSVDADIERLQLVDDVFDGCRRLMVDPNEAFSPTEAIRRVRAYEAAGFDVYWVEDPVTRTDLKGIARVSRALPETNINTGEYVDLAGKRELLEHEAADILNVHSISKGRAAAAMAGTYGVPLSVGNTPADLGAHAAAALPECAFVEYSMSPVNELFSGKITFEDGSAHLAEVPGHSLTLDEAAAARYERTAPSDGDSDDR